MHSAALRHARVFALACLVYPSTALLASPVHSRAASAVPGITGIVKDSAGHTLPNVTVAIVSLKRSATTDPAGRFALRGLTAGHHHVTALLIGFAREETEVDVPASGPDVSLTIIMRQTPLRLESVVVTAASPTGDALGITQSTVDLAGKDLARTLSSSVATTLESEPGMATRYNGPAANMPIIRGLTGERILVLQDGERSGDLSSAASDHGTTIDPLAADRIEVVRGPASLLYGSSALGGVVNVISNDIPSAIPSHISGYVGGQSESATPGGALTGGITIPVGRSVALTTGGGFRSTGQARMGGGAKLLNSDSRNNHENVGLAVIGERGTLGFSVGRYDFRYGLPGEEGDPELGGKIDGARNDGRLRAEINGSTMFPLFTLTGTVQSYKHSEIENTGTVATSFNLKTQTAGVTAKTKLGRADGAIGASALLKEYGAEGDEALTPAADTRTGGIFLFQDLPLSSADPEHGVHLQFGARYDSYRIQSKTGDPKFGPALSRTFDAASGSLGVTLPVTRFSSLAFSGARAFRAPSVEELFSNAFHAAAGTFDVGSPGLKAETNSGVDVVYRVQSGRVNAQFATYYSDIKGYVAPSIVGDTTTDEGETVPLNHIAQKDATLRGAEARVEGEVVKHFVIGAMGDLTRGRFKDGTDIPFMPAARLGAHVRWDNGSLSAGADVKHGLKQERVSGGEVDIPTEAYTLLNLSIGYSLINGGYVHSITLRADNLLDEEYRDATSRIKRFALNPGRNLAVVYRVLF